MLYRYWPPARHRRNGLGGKREGDELPLPYIYREVWEEAGRSAVLDEDAVPTTTANVAHASERISWLPARRALPRNWNMYPMEAKNHEYESQLQHIIRSNDWFMTVLEAVRDCNPPDWFVGSGVVRNIVWHHLHGYTPPTPLADVDVAFFDPDDLTPGRDSAVQEQLLNRLPNVPWQAKNQAAVHLWYENVFGYAVHPVQSSADAIGTWPETATCIGVRLLPHDEVLVAAPLGLDDLFQMILRRNPQRVSVELFRQRLREKAIQRKWPRVRVIDG